MLNSTAAARIDLGQAGLTRVPDRLRQHRVELRLGSTISSEHGAGAVAYLER
jgi:hypothetical protein